MAGGILNCFKPAGLTSHDLVDQVRRLTGERRVGHAGTLDPFADGVLLVGFGSGTKILPYLSDLSKEYEATLRLGEATETMDTEGEVVGRGPVPRLSAADIQLVMSRFLGSQEQMPPAYSALKVGGVRAYHLARQGIEVVLPLRTIVVEEMSLLDWTPPDVRFRALVSKGTYLRKLAVDLAGGLGTCGHLAALRRTAIGRFGIGGALAIEELHRRAAEGLLAGDAITLAAALAHLPTVILDEAGTKMIRNGLYPEGHASIDVPVAPGSPAAAVGPDGNLVAILRGASQGEGRRKAASFVFDRVIAE